MCTRTCIYGEACAHLHACKHIRTHTQTHIHIHAHMHTPLPPLLSTVRSSADGRPRILPSFPFKAVGWRDAVEGRASGCSWLVSVRVGFRVIGLVSAWVCVAIGRVFFFFLSLFLRGCMPGANVPFPSVMSSRSDLGRLVGKFSLGSSLRRKG